MKKTKMSLAVSQQSSELIIKIIMNSGSSNPSDYQFLLRTLNEGNPLARAESLQRLMALVQSDKKQFASYAKRIVMLLQQLMLEPKEDINLLACNLALQIINLNPRDIEFYLKSKLLRPMVLNLGDAKPQLRKTAHYCLLGYLRAFRSFDDLIEVYFANGVSSAEWQLRQKAINSFQSILVMEMRYLNWGSSQFKSAFEVLLGKLKDENGFVQKAAEQCLLSLCKVQQIRNFSKRLSLLSFGILKRFCEEQYELGHLLEIKLDITIPEKQSGRYHEEVTLPNPKPDSHELIQHRSHAEQIKNASIRVNNQNEQRPLQHTPREQHRPQKQSLRKAESVIAVSHTKQLQHSQPLRTREVRNPEKEDKNLRRESSVLLPPISMTNPGVMSRQEKMEAIVGKKLLQDLRNDHDWKVRLEAMEQLQTRFQISRDEFDAEMLMKGLLPTLVRLLGDANFKVALVALKVVEELMKAPAVSLEVIIPQIVERISDSKVALRQNIAKLVRSEYLSSHNALWLDHLLVQLRRTTNSNIREEILNILGKLYDDENIPYPFEKVLEAVYPLMDDLKTKIKIKSLDLLANVTIKSQKFDRAKAILATKMNQVYYQMYLQKIGKQLKSFRDANPSVVAQKERERDKEREKEKSMHTSMNHITRKANKIINTTATSLPRYAQEQNSTVKTAFYTANREGVCKDSMISQQSVDIGMPEAINVTHDTTNDTTNGGSVRKLERSPRRRAPKVESRLTTNNSIDDVFPPFVDPAKELRAIMIEIKSDDWQVSNQALNKFRRIIMHHSQLLVTSITKAIIPDLMKLTQSLRSTLSKNAVAAVNELSAKVKRQLDSEFQLIFGKLVRRTLDTNSFISEEVRRALLTVCCNCGQGRVVSLLQATHISRAIPIKTAIVYLLEGVAFLPRFYEKELDRMVLILVDFLSEGSLQIRERTKALLNSLIVSERGQQVLALIPNDQRNKLKKREEPAISPSKVDSLPEQSVIQQKKVVQPVQTEEIFPKRKKKNKITEFPTQFDEIEGLLQNCESSDWKARLQNMTLISDICSRYPEEIGQHRISSRIVDVLSKQINDPNAKVALNALKIFQELVARSPGLAEASLSVILNEVFVCFSSGRAEIRTQADQLFNVVCQHVEQWMLTQHICNGALYSTPKSRPLIVQKLTSLVPTLYHLKLSIFQKNVYPTINKLAEEGRPQLSTPLRELLQAIYTEAGEDCMSFLKQKAKQLIFQ